MTFELRPLSVFGRFPLASLAERGIRVSERDSACLLLIRARGTLPGALRAQVEGGLAVELPDGPRRVQVDGLCVAGIGPQMWFAIGDGHSAARITSLHLALGEETAVIVDQSHAWSVLRIAGPRARESLTKLFAVDLHDRVLTPRDFVVTVAAQIDAMLWRIEGAEDAEPVFEIAVPRSYAGSFWHALSMSVS